MSTVKEAIESATGFDEIAVKQKFGSPLGELMQTDRLQGLRAVVFIQGRRDGKKDDEAYHVAQSMPLKEVQERFSAEDAAADFEEQPPTTKP